MPETKPRLIYFGIKGRAEAIRLTFYVGGVDFEDVRISGEEFGKNKAAGVYPLGSVPVLEVGGKTIAQSQAILRYAGKLGDLYPQDPFQALLVDEVALTAEDIIGATVPSMHESDPDKQAALRADLISNTYPKFFKYYEKKLAESKSGYYVGDEITIADLQVYPVLTWFSSGTLTGLPTTILDDYPHIKAHLEKVASHPKVKEWDEAHNE